MAKSRSLSDLSHTVEVAKALADPGRLRVLRALQGRELCVCQLTELLQLAPSTVSKHMSILRHAGLVEARKDGRWAWYRRAEAPLSPAAAAAIEWLDGSLGADDRLREDERRLRRILGMSLKELCRRSEAC